MNFFCAMPPTVTLCPAALISKCENMAGFFSFFFFFIFKSFSQSTLQLWHKSTLFEKVVMLMGQAKPLSSSIGFRFHMICRHPYKWKSGLVQQLDYSALLSLGASACTSGGYDQWRRDQTAKDMFSSAQESCAHWARMFLSPPKNPFFSPLFGNKDSKR